jgi:hypothetical protein
MKRALPIILLLSLALPVAAGAEHGPPSVITNNTVSPDCLKVVPTYMLAVQPHHFQPSRGPAIAITNKCEKQASVLEIKEGDAAQDKVPARITSMAGGYAKYSEFVFFLRGPECTFPLTPPAKGKPRCHNLPIPPKDTLTLTIPWGTTYKISGLVGEEDKFTATGTILNPRDPTQAIDLVLPKAREGDAAAQYELGILYGRDGKRHDETEYLRWMLRAANQGYAQAQIEMAQYYETHFALGNAVEAAYWWMLAAKNPWDALYDARKHAEDRLSDEDLEKVKQRVAAFKPLSAAESVATPDK